jgi:hypothetical protein
MKKILAYLPVIGIYFSLKMIYDGEMGIDKEPVLFWSTAIVNAVTISAIALTTII